MFSQLFKKLLKVAWFLPGFLLWATFPPMGERMDCLFALAPLLWLSRREVDAGLVAKRWLQSGAFFWIATLSWMPAIVKNGGPWPLVLLGWFALAAYCALYFGLYGYLSAKYWGWARGSYWRRLLGVLVVEPVLWCGLELVRSRLLGGFSWNQLGVVAVNSGFGAPAALGGVYLCSAVVILINGTVAGIAERVWRPERSGFANLKRLGTLETLLAFTLIFGIYKMSSFVQPTTNNQQPTTSLKVAMIQRNFPCVFKAQEESPLKVYDSLLDNVSTLAPDLVVLSESAMCEFGPVDGTAANAFARWVAKKTGGAALLAGGSRSADGKSYNSAALYCSNPQPSTFNLQPSTFNLQPSTYDKVHLVPFGEFIPGDKLIPALQKLAPVGSCTPGELKMLTLPLPTTNHQPPTTNNHQPTTTNQQPTTNHHQPTTNNQQPTTNLGLAICFEDTDSAQMRALAKQGAQVLFFITNDSWFSHSIEAEQHAWQAVARAVETGLPVVRVGNSGVTGTISPDGRTTWLLGPDGRPLVDRQGTMLDRIAVKAVDAPTTPYVVFGDAPLLVIFALLIGGMILIKYTHHYE